MRYVPGIVAQELLVCPRLPRAENTSKAEAREKPGRRQAHAPTNRDHAHFYGVDGHLVIIIILFTWADHDGWVEFGSVELGLLGLVGCDIWDVSFG
jgi:hypothetical protein